MSRRTGKPGLELGPWSVVLVVTLAGALACGPVGPAPVTSASSSVSVSESEQAAALGVSPAALRLHRRALVLDTHIDTPQRLAFEEKFDLAARNRDGHVDIPRMREGGLDAAFFSIWFPGTVTGPAAVRRALGLIDEVRETVRANARDLTLATSVAVKPSRNRARQSEFAAASFHDNQTFRRKFSGHEL